MPEKTFPGPVRGDACIREAVCIHTKKIYDSCKDKDCIEDLRFYPTQNSQSVIDRALSVRAGKAELLYVAINVEPVGFNRGFYTVDVRYFYRVTAEAFIGAVRPVEVTGLCIFDKRVLLFGGEGSAKIFSSKLVVDGIDEQKMQKSNLPVAYVEAVDPIVLGVKLVDVCDCRPCCDCDVADVPPCICACFGCDLSFGNECKRILVTLGQFSIIRLERDSQLLIPVYDYCLPEKDCSATSGDEDDPCEVFRSVKFPVNEFFPSSETNCCPCKD